MARDWAEAWARSLYGPGGFYVTGPGARQGPAAHFRTSVHVGETFHRALAELLQQVDTTLDQPPGLDLIDVGAGRGELVGGVLGALPPDIRARVRPLCLDVRPRPADLPDAVEWREGVAPQSLSLARPSGIIGLVVAHEWLDDLPCHVVEVDEACCPRLVLVADDGSEQLGPELQDDAGCAAYGVDGAAALSWLQRWWPAGVPGARAEVGVHRDRAWAALTAQLRAGTALAIDYGHVLAERLEGRYDTGTLSAYAAGRPVDPVPDGRCDITAHVAVDACAAAGRIGTDTVTLTRQREALTDLGVSAGLPSRQQAVSDPAGYAAELQRASQAAELRDRGGLGAFWWLRLDRAPALTPAVAPSERSGHRTGPRSPGSPGPSTGPAPAVNPGAEQRP